MKKILFILSTTLLVAASLIIPTSTAEMSPEKTFYPYATLEVNRNDKTGAVELVLTTHGKKDGDKVVRNNIKDGVEVWEKFDKWYEDLFGLTYLDSNYKRLWTQLRRRGADLAKRFFNDEMLKAVTGCKLLVVVDEIHPFMADAFKFGDRWLFEIVPIVHSLTPGEKDLSDNIKYSSYLVLDCQGPKDREGKEAPAVYENLGKIPTAKGKLLISLTREETIDNLQKNKADILHLATHAYPDEFFPGRNKPGVKSKELAKMKLPFHTVLSTGCNTGNPVFANGILQGETKFMIASMYVTSGKDGITFGNVFYPALFSGRTPFEAFYDVKKRITGNKSDFPDILRFAFFVR